MKYIIMILDGAADYPLTELGGLTPLQAAKKENIDNLAVKSKCGLFRTIPENFVTGSAVANLSILGYDPIKYFQGRGVLEAAAMKVPLDGNDVVLRCNTISILEDGSVKNHSAGHISSEESSLLIDTANKEFGGSNVVFYPGVSYRHIMLLKGDYSPEIKCAPPHDYTGRYYEDILVKPLNERALKTSNLLNRIIRDSKKILENHPVNIRRRQQGKDKANMLWPWSPGKRPFMQSYHERFGISGAVISAVDLIKGLGIYCGFKVIDVKGATGLYDTNYEGKAEETIRALKEHDLVYLHVEAADEAGHEGNAELKIRCIEDFDKRLVGKILEKIDKKSTSIALLPDHYTPVSTKAHSTEPVPFMIYNPLVEPDKIDSFDEVSCARGSYGVIPDNSFITLFLGK